MKKVSVVDYGVGNLLSVAQAFERLGASVEFVSTPEEIARAERLVLPGVGAFRDGMAGLHERGLVEPLRDYARTGRPFLGICLGMQLMLAVSEEFGETEGLALIEGRVVPVPNTRADGTPHKVPHIGWNELATPHADAAWADSILGDLPDRRDVYFVHSFMAMPTDGSHVLAVCDYHGQQVTAAVRKGHLMGCQFHPEKSGPTGLRILQRFLEL